MCGIIGYAGPREAQEVLLDGLKRLEYRGYDSAGVAIVGSGLKVFKDKGEISKLSSTMPRLSGHLGVGHTRWATCGKPSQPNAHPFLDCTGKMAVVHNGIIENHLELKAALVARGHEFKSETDTEIFAHLIADALADGNRDLREAVRASLAQVHGTYAIAVVSEKRPDEIVAAKNASPLVVGYGKGENFLASDVPAILEHTREVVYLEEGELAVLTAGAVSLYGRNGEQISRKPRRIEWSTVAAEKEGHKHFMHKEIFEQPRAVADTIRGRASLEQGDVTLDGMELTEEYVRSLQRVVIVACGTSSHAGLSGRQMIESVARIPTQVELGSEFRNRDPLVDERTLCLAVTQSGETADTLAAMKEAAARGARGMAICNVQGSTAARLAEATLLTHAGPEIGVASTKAFTTQLVVLLLLALRLGQARGTLDPAVRAEIVQALRELPALLERVASTEQKIHQWAQKWHEATDFLYLGRGPLYPIALEGALKLKELSYIHAEGYPAGEMKHGPIALIDRHLPIVAVMPRDAHREKVLSNLQEAAARDGRILALVEEGDTGLDHIAEDVLHLPKVNPWLAPILYVVPLQLLSYHIAVIRGCDVDQPRNLAKSVTVE